MRLPKEISQAVYERDNHQCVQCQSTKGIVPHHKIHRSKGGSDELDNLITLCLECHQKEHPWTKFIKSPLKVFFRSSLGVILIREHAPVPKAIMRLKEQRDLKASLIRHRSHLKTLRG